MLELTLQSYTKSTGYLNGTALKLLMDEINVVDSPLSINMKSWVEKNRVSKWLLHANTSTQKRWNRFDIWIRKNYPTVTTWMLGKQNPNPLSDAWECFSIMVTVAHLAIIVIELQAKNTGLLPVYELVKSLFCMLHIFEWIFQVFIFGFRGYWNRWHIWAILDTIYSLFMCFDLGARIYTVHGCLNNYTVTSIYDVQFQQKTVCVVFAYIELAIVVRLLKMCLIAYC